MRLCRMSLRVCEGLWVRHMNWGNDNGCVVWDVRLFLYLKYEPDLDLVERTELQDDTNPDIMDLFPFIY